MKRGFTLAETLITIGIIGVVSAITIPTLVQNQQKKSLEVSFKKAYANLLNAFNKALIDDPILFDDSTPHSYNPPIAQAVYKEYRKLKSVTVGEYNKYYKNIRTYTKQKGGYPECSQIFNTSSSNHVITPDGSAISIMQNCGTTYITLDTNGLNKGPNAYGHDYFLFQITRKGKIIPAEVEGEYIYDENGNKTSEKNTSEEAKNKCSQNSPSVLNGILCANYTLQNICPDDQSKNYWECLP